MNTSYTILSKNTWRWLGLGVSMIALIGIGVKSWKVSVGAVPYIQSTVAPTDVGKSTTKMHTLARPKAEVSSNPLSIVKISLPPSAIAKDWQSRFEHYIGQKGIHSQQLPEEAREELGQKLAELIHYVGEMQTQKQNGQLPSHATQLRVAYLAFSARNQMFDLTHLELVDFLRENGVDDGNVAR